MRKKLGNPKIEDHVTARPLEITHISEYLDPKINPEHLSYRKKRNS
ncbi:hypothetical protein [Brumimicrobium mesophilum]|nr:hypothetical protein [Brumimicrobium mesophilum]